MDDTLVMDDVKSKADLNEEFPRTVLTELDQYVWCDSGLGFGSSLPGLFSCGEFRLGTHCLKPLKVLLEVTLIAVFHDEVKLVVVGNEAVVVLADVLVTEPAHQLLLLQRRLHRSGVLKGNLFHRIQVVVDYDIPKVVKTAAVDGNTY